MKKNIFRACLILALVLSLALSAMAADPTLTASQEECGAGESVTVTVSFADNPGVWGMDVKVGYDAGAMTLTAVTNGTVFANTERTEGNMAGNPYILSYERAGFDNTTASGVLATMTFAVKSDAQPGTYPVTVSCTKGNAINADEADVELRTVNGSVTVKSATPVTEGTCGANGDNLTWSLDEDVLTIRGTGAMKNFTADTTPWKALCELIQKIVVKNGVTTIGDYAFCGCGALSEVRFGEEEPVLMSGPMLNDLSEDGLTSIGEGAFADCTSLERLTIPEGVENIGNGAFSGCTAMEEVTIPESVSSIGEGAFDNCSALTEVVYGGTAEQWAALGYHELPEDPYFCPAAYSFTLALEENIDVNFYVKVAHGLPVDGYAVSATFGGETTFDRALTAEDYADTTEDGYDRYRVAVASAASFEMTKPVAVTVQKDGETVKTAEYSVRQYCMNKLDDALVSQELKALCKAVLDYGANAQLYFDGMSYWEGSQMFEYEIDTADLANKLSNPDNTLPQHPGAVGMAASKSEGLREVSPTLLLGSETKLKIYFKTDEPASEVAIWQDGSVLLEENAPVAQDPRYVTYFVRTPGLSPLDLMRSYYFDMDNGESVTYSPLNFIANHSTGKVGKLCTALYAYADTAAAYAASLEN